MVGGAMMGAKHALVVDDSKSARVVLRKMLEKHSLTVETANSAEDAIDFLSRHAPDVIFMDHLMPGMDGFQAIEHIKKNPDTAMIPIVMYTSQDGEVYVGQARALGAVDVLAKDIRPTELQKVLSRLSLIDTEDGQEKPHTLTALTTKAKNVSQVRINLSDSTIRRLARETSDMVHLPTPATQKIDQITGVLEELRLNIRQDVLSVTRKSHRQFSQQFQSTDSRFQHLTDLIENSNLAPPSSGKVHLWWLVVIIICVFLTWQTTRQNGSPDSRYTVETITQMDKTIEFLRQENVSLNQDLAITRNNLPPSPNSSNWLIALQWAVNLSGTFDYTDTPLDDSQLIKLRSLVDQLNQNGFEGMVIVNVHVGDFCLSRNSFDELAVSANDVPLGGCDQIGLSTDEAISTGLRQSINFANYVTSIQADLESSITLRIVSHGNSAPKLAYPTEDKVKTAEKWNTIASQNNRIEYILISN